MKLFSMCPQSYLTFLLYLLLAAGNSYAQTPPTPPPNTDASVTEARIDKEAKKVLIGKKKKVEFKKPGEEKRAIAKSDEKFFIRRVVIQGNESMPEAELDSLTVSYTGREITLTEAKELAQRIEAAIRERGFITAFAYVPPQKLEEETLIIQILEGRMGQLHVEGNKWFPTKHIEHHWHYQRGEVLKYEDIIKNLRRLGDNPDHSGQIILKAGEEANETDIYLKIKDRFPGHASFSYDNQGVPSTGTQRFGFNVRHTNFLFPDSVFLAGTVFGSHFGAQFYQYLLRLNGYGTKAVLGFSHSQVAPKGEYEDLDINGISQTYTVGLRQEFILKDRFYGALNLGFDFKNSRTQNIIGLARRDRERVINTSFELGFDDRFGSTSLTQSANFGVNGLGASGNGNPYAGRPGAKYDFVKFFGNITRTLRTIQEQYLSLAFSYQLSPDKLLPQEEFYLGGVATVRGYPEGDYLGDQGVLFNAEYMVPLPVPGAWRLPKSEIPLRKQIQLYPFVDQGYGELRGAGDYEVKSRFLFSTGFGARIQVYKHVFARLEMGHVLGDEPLTQKDHTRFHFRLGTEF